jgi:hypothetical protein
MIETTTEFLVVRMGITTSAWIWRQLQSLLTSSTRRRRTRDKHTGRKQQPVLVSEAAGQASSTNIPPESVKGLDSGIISSIELLLASGQLAIIHHVVILP